MFNRDDIINYADKLLIGLSDTEADTILSEFELIDQNIDQINKIDGLSEIEPSFMPFDLYEGVLREDEVKPSVDVDEILSNTKEKIGREIKVPKVVD